MRVLISHDCVLWLSRKAILRARELGADWASTEHMPLVDEPNHYAYGDEKKTQHREDSGYSLLSTLPRHDPTLLQVFDELGSEGMVSEEHTGVAVVEVPDDVEYFIDSYVGEWVAEAHRTWTDQTPEEGHPGGSPVFTKDSKFSDFLS